MNKLAAEIAEYLDILRSRERLFGIVKDEMIAVKEQYATPRRTQILDVDGDVEDEDLIAREDMVVTVSHAGYIKRVPLSTYRAQRRGGKGRSGMQTKEEDFVQRLFVASTHTPVLFFSSLGQVYKEKVWRLPLAAPQARGKALVNMLPLEQGERITTIMPLPEDESSWATLDVMFATTRGTVRRNKLSDFTDVRRNGLIAMKLDEGEAIVDVATASEHDDVLLTTREGQCIRFPVNRRARVPGPHLHGRARHRARRRRPRDLAVDPAPFRRRPAKSAPPISSAPGAAARPGAEVVGREPARGRGERRRGRASRRAFPRPWRRPSRSS